VDLSCNAGTGDGAGAGNDRHPLCYSAGVMVLSKETATDPLSFGGARVDPVLPQERSGTIANVVFLWHRPARRSWLTERFDVHYGWINSMLAYLDASGPY